MKYKRLMVILLLSAMTSIQTSAQSADGDGRAPTERSSTGVVEEEVRQTILAWGAAWVVRDDAETFELQPVAERFYVPDLLAFDTSDDAGKTVIRGLEEFVTTWQPFVRSWDHWEFNVLPESIDVHVVTDDMAWATLFIDNYGRKANGTEFHGPAQGTLLMRRRDGAWRIVHEHISLPRKDPHQ